MKKKTKKGWKTEFLYHKLCCTATLATRIASIQSELGYPGLITECEGLVEKLKLPDIGGKSLSKLQWKKIVKKSIIEKNRNDLLQMIATKYKKLDRVKLSNEQFETKEYLKIKNIHDSRLISKRCINSQPVHTFLTNSTNSCPGWPAQ